ncbi:siderophore-interacting protein [Tsukamurella sp. 8F]|uniref:siderophore-interacting protein n=1 Tax=unclassified Tsukamurella TaxID=2633480 RepID=UPI0023BA0197|nr:MULTISPECIES: siderophore-interacting protein [unclassified Tsukamurella]MDF0532213.1 siderophore-interacting protein [Tsukamurella sp. 8J]MDF0588082.1 siderophore-interacting protein [Tsukamurella sp. 8F]
MTAPRRPRPQHVLTVTKSEEVSRHLVRITARGDSLAGFADPEIEGLPNTDAYVKLLFADPALGLEPPYDLESLPPEQRPVTRTYTVRRFDRAARELAIEFVVHGDEGLAGPWAQRAQPGDTLVLMGPGSGYSPDPDASWHLLAGDLSALPAIASALEDLPDGARGSALIEVASADDAIDLVRPAGLEIEWLVNPDPSDAAYLGQAVADADWPEDVSEVHVFAHGERESIKAVRKVLKEKGIDRGRLSISGYWARGRAEQEFQAEKRTPIGQID